MTIRDELRLMGPERVRAGMIAFKHQAGHNWKENGRAPCPDLSHNTMCCFLMHAAPTLSIREFPAVEGAFEYRNAATREDLHAECVAYLAENGTVPEIAPRVVRKHVAALVMVALLIVLI